MRLWRDLCKRWQLALWLCARPPLNGEAYLRSNRCERLRKTSERQSAASLLLETDRRGEGLLLQTSECNQTQPAETVLFLPCGYRSQGRLVSIDSSCHREACGNGGVGMSRSRPSCEGPSRTNRPRAGFVRDNIFFGFPRHMQRDRRLNPDDNGFCAGPSNGDDT